MSYVVTKEKESPDTPLLSILCITYNHEKYIADALDSFFSQKIDFPIEIVIGDDCSTDKTVLIAESYLAQHPGLIRLMTSPVNLGVTRNFKRTLQACKGKYIAICEGDDYWCDTNKLQTQIDFLEKYPDYVITYHDAFLLTEFKSAPKIQIINDFRCDATSDQLIQTRPISTLTACFRNVVRDIPKELECAPVLDLCLWSLLGEHGKGKHLSSIRPAAYRIHGGGVFSTQQTEGKIRLTMQSYLCLSQYYSKKGKEKISKKFDEKLIIMSFLLFSRFDKIKIVAKLIDGLFFHPLYTVQRLLKKINR